MYKVIKNEEQYLEYLNEFEKLMDIDPDEGTEESDKFDLLALLIKEYEDIHYKIDLPDPIEAIKFRMDQMGMKAKDLVGIIGSKSKVSEVLNGKIKLSLNMIKNLNEKLGIPLNVLFETENETIQMTSAVAEQEKVIEELLLSLEKDFMNDVLAVTVNPISDALIKIKDGIKFVYDCTKPSQCDRVSDKKGEAYA